MHGGAAARRPRLGLSASRARSRQVAPARLGSRSVPPPPAAPPSADPTSLRSAVVAATLTTLAVTVASFAAPERYAATVVGGLFLGATWWLVLRRDDDVLRVHGLALGGLLTREPLHLGALARAGLRACAAALAVAAVVFPPFVVGYVLYWGPTRPFVFRLPPSPFDDVLGQLLVIALPEEAFFRGYLQTALDGVWRPRWRVLGADLGPGWLVASAVFAAGHMLTIHHPARLAVFFPALLFGWLRARTGGIGAAFVFHAACNLLAATLGRGYGFTP